MTVLIIIATITLVVWLDNPREENEYDDTHYLNWYIWIIRIFSHLKFIKHKKNIILLTKKIKSYIIIDFLLERCYNKSIILDGVM